MSSTINPSQNPIRKLRGWYDGQLGAAKAAGKAEYEAELAKFNDAFEQVSRLDGCASDTNRNPGEVTTDGTTFSGVKSLRKTDQGFALMVSSGIGLLGWLGCVAPYFGSPAPQSETHRTTNYLVNETTGQILVTRNITSANYVSSTETRESFTLDTNSGQLLERKTDSQLRMHDAQKEYPGHGFLSGGHDPARRF